MKRSEMIEVIKRFMHGPSQNPYHHDEAEAFLNKVEEMGMLPPKDDKVKLFGDSEEISMHKWESEDEKR